MKQFLIAMLAALLLCTSALADGLSVQQVLDLLQTTDDGYDTLHAMMSPDMQAALPPEALSQLMMQLEGTFGSYLGLKDDLSIAAAEGYTVHTQTMDMALMDLTCTMALDANGLIAGLNFTLAVQPEAIGMLPSGVTEEAVTIGEAPWQLPGMLSIPHSAEPVPAVVLVHGSGPNDMDETAYAVKPFRDLAAALAREGIAVLRYDKRTYTHGAAIAAGDMTAFTVEEETIQDAIAAGRLLRDDPRIDPERIYVVGHSLGAMLAPRIVAESDGLFCGMALLNGTNASLAEVIIQQNKDAIATMTAEQQAAYAPAIAALEAQAAGLAAMTEEEARVTQFAGQSAYYFWEMLQHPMPAEQMKILALPTLIINGSRDFQVRETQGRLLWEASLDMDAPWLTCLWADVNHMLMKPDVPAEVAGTIGEYNISCTVDTSVTEAICAFINHTEE